ncbi:hypothetical protein C8D92_10387 [Tamilnaduibacter salinus]|uniref:Uncharacterized protein n=1 Tax=Tamilnaduibacter salinus TaxID=1484056 RepID=A0A2A2I185_9GAMM|nr:hypothetical protein [Tamilnaduibacter salinus]PAV25044.1 hypothetical protein CF392_12965 [Tamilnaduibacter salinus]PVY77402.1 hypothetical protein C8D92_10387 [Tamilnaduibacter salinus]
MPDESGLTDRLKLDAITNGLLVVALALYFFFARGQQVGDDLTFTALGATLMVFATFAVLHTAQDLIGLVARRRPTQC